MRIKLRMVLVISSALFFFLVSSVVIGNSQPFPPIRDEVFDAARQAQAWVDLWNSYDLALVDKLFLADPPVTYFSSERVGLIRGIVALREHHQRFGFVLGGKTSQNRLWVEDIHSNVFGDVAVILGVWYFQRDSGETQQGPLTIVYVRQKGVFRIAHMHVASYEGQPGFPAAQVF